MISWEVFQTHVCSGRSAIQAHHQQQFVVADIPSKAMQMASAC
jgi:hypothetical protein